MGLLRERRFIAFFARKAVFARNKKAVTTVYAEYFWIHAKAAKKQRTQRGTCCNNWAKARERIVHYFVHALKGAAINFRSLRMY